MHSAPTMLIGRSLRQQAALLALLLLLPLNGIAGVVAADSLHAGNEPRASLHRVRSIIDGDTIRLERLGKVRLLGINAPEVDHRDKPGEPYGDRARDYLTQLLTGRRVYLEFDQVRRDRFGRLLAHVTREDGMRINERLLREGLARALFLQPNLRHLDHYYRLEAEALQAAKGIWAQSAYRIRPAEEAGDCLNRFCRLEGELRKKHASRNDSYFELSGQVRIAIANEILRQFQQAGKDPGLLDGTAVVVRGWVVRLGDKPYIRLHHPYQIIPVPPLTHPRQHTDNHPFGRGIYTESHGILAR